MNNAYRLLLAFFPADSTGSVDSAIQDAAYSATKFGTDNVFPLDVAITSINRGGTTIASREVNSILDMDAWSRYESGKATQGEITVNFERGVDRASILAALGASSEVEPFLGVLKVGKFRSTGTGTREYAVVFTTAALLVDEGSASANAKDVFTSSLKFRPTGKPTEGASANAQKMTLTVATGAIAVAAATP